MARGLVALAIAWAALGAWGLWQLLSSAGANDGPSTAQVEAQQKRIGELEQRIATLTRSDQISRDANTDLQGTLAERDEEIAGLRADVAFYERFVGATGQRRGLSVHAFELRNQTGPAWHFTATLTQNMNRGAINTGNLLVGVEGSQGGTLKRLAWADLRQQANAPGVAYSFKYFQRVEGDVILPEGFTPVRLVVRLVPKGGAAVEQSFAWSDAAKSGNGG